MTLTDTASVPRSTRRDLLRTALLLDAGVTGLNGIAYLAGAGLLDRILGLPAGWLYAAGIFLTGYGLAVAALGLRTRVSRSAAWTVVAINAAWAVGSLTAVALGWGSPTTVGAVWLVAQAVVVGGFAAVQAVALRRGR